MATPKDRAKAKAVRADKKAVKAKVGKPKWASWHGKRKGGKKQ